MKSQDVEQARENMILNQLRPWGVLDQRLLDILRSIPRENFMPEAYRNLAFVDMPIPVSDTQVLFPPKMEARLIQALDVQPTDRILELGTGTGYTAAVLAALGKKVISVGIDADIAESARKNVARSNIDDLDVTFEVGDVAGGWPNHRPYDVIFVTGSLPIYNDTFEKELCVGGRLLVVVGASPAMEAMLITRIAENEWTRESLMETVVPPLADVQEPDKFVF